MEEHQEQKQHVCKFCKKRFPCGRSLGGHMRSHMSSNNSSSAEAAKEKKLLLDKNKKQSSSVFNGGSSSNNNTDIEGGGGGQGGVGYTLRENPKKTWRLSDSIDGSLTQEKVCKECGKAFQSWKALFGHMRCHSEKEREREREKERVLSADSFGEEEDSWVDENQKLVMDNQSDNEAAAPKRRRRRSRRMRYKNTTTTTNGTTTTTTNANTVTATTTTTTSSSFSFANGSTTCVSEIEQEQEEVAMCLMMLSRDVGCWGGLNSVVESSDNNSVVLEVRSSSLVKEIAEKDDCNAGQCVTEEKLRDNKLKSVVLESDIVRFEKNQSELGKSSFGVLRNGFKKVESEVSVAGSIGADRFEKANEVGFELGRGVAKCTEAEMGKDLIKEANDQADSEGGKHNLSKRAKCDAFDPEMGTGSSKKTRYDASECEVGKDSPNKNKFECTTCNKTFHSYQALGGHRASHKRVKGCFASKIETSENSIETDITPEPALDSKLMKLCSNRSPNGTTETSYRAKNGKHECPICFKVFASGQALGGHKRSHVVEVSEARSNQAIVIQQKLPEIRDLLDLNLPAPVEEDSTNTHIGFKPWWVGTNHKHEPPMGLISN